ncbi:tetratricopeptide repeat protein [Dactylosporangium sp. NPDC000244]|uniref:AfsR/SARP family transcriptional regulator n=1 Tax=Dactylosporangium sp. NPDC000244 TaxID=3154365 RepID=UPI00332564C2
MIDTPTEIRLLGPVEIHVQARVLPIGPPQQRLVLAALALDAGRTVQVESLIDRVWDEVPNGARRTLHVLIARLRRILQHGDTVVAPIVHRSGGYVLDIDPRLVDILRFRNLVERANEPDCSPRDEVRFLREARQLWRGDPLADLSGRWAFGIRDTWLQHHVAAITAWARAEVAAANPAAVISPLVELTAAYPLVESLAEVLMRAMFAVGRTADALDRYLATRQRLADELGVDPGPDLEGTYRAILRGDLEVRSTRTLASQTAAPRRVVPAQLPADVAGFSGRNEELGQIDAVLAHAGAPDWDRYPTAVPILVISGTAGVGKTALAIRWAHRVGDRFPDGQLYLNLRGYDPDQPMTAADALVRCLAALGIPNAEIPVDLEDCASRYRTEIAGRRMLIVLDNASSVEQVRPLLPGTGSCAVLVTSRDSLAGLVAVYGARRLDLELLPHSDAIALLRCLIGARVDAAPAAAAVLADQCVRLPLALRIAAELAVLHSATPLADLVAELADRQQRLDLLDAGGDPRAAVAAVFSWSFQHLPPAAARAFPLLGLHPGPDLDVYAAAALADTTLAQARRILGVLARANLVRTTNAGRYGMHDLLRAYATSLATGDAAAEEPQSSLGRLFDYYLAAAASAMDVLNPAETHRRPRIPPPATPTPEFADSDMARKWLDGERFTLASVTAYTAAHGWPDHTVRLSNTLFRYLDNGYYTDALVIHRHANGVAERNGDHVAQAQALLNLGVTEARLARYAAAADHFRRSILLHRQAGDLIGEGRALSNLGSVEQRLGRYQATVEHNEQALALFRKAGDVIGEARALDNLGFTERLLGRYEEASAYHGRALALFREAGDVIGEAASRDNLGTAQQLLGRYEAAEEQFSHTLALYRGLNNPRGQAWAKHSLGDLHTRLGRADEAAEHHRQALALFREIGERDGEVWALNGLGEAVHNAGRPSEALVHHRNALSISTETGARDQQARAHRGLARAHHTLSDTTLAQEHFAAALALYTDLDMPEANNVRTDLAALAARSPLTSPSGPGGPSAPATASSSRPRH